MRITSRQLRLIIRDAFLTESVREGNAYKRLVDQFPHLENVIEIIADHKKAGATLIKWLFSRFVEESVEEIHPIEDAITSITGFADSFEKIESKWRTGTEFKKAVSEFFRTPAWEKENSILAIIPRMTADQIDKLPSLASREKAFFEINVSEEEMESDRVGRVGPWNLWMPTTRERSCKIAEFDPVTLKPKTTWCTARMAGSNLFYNYVGRPGENMTLFYIIKQDPRTEEEKEAKVPDPRSFEDWLSVGFINGVPELGGKSGGMSVDRENEGLTEQRLRSILGPYYDEIMQAFTAKNEELGGKHPARAKIEDAARDPSAFASLIKGLGKEELEDMKKIILQEPEVHPAIIAKLARDKLPSVRASVVHHGSVDAETLRMLATDESLSVRRAVATKVKTPVDVLELMADDRALWPYVAQNRRTPTEKLFVIAEDPRMEVIRALLMNINLPEEILQKFEQSDDKRVRWQASGLRTRKEHARGLSENHLRSMIREVASICEPSRVDRTGQHRRIIREAISTSRMSHSQGWIDPEGRYYYNPRLSDHGEWAVHKLLDLRMSDTMLDGIRAAVSRYVRRGDSELRIPDSNDVREIHLSIPWIVEDVAKGLLLGMGWGKVMNAYSIDVHLPSRTIIDRWLELGMEADVDPDAKFTIYSGNDTLMSGDMGEIERFMKRLRR